MRHLMSPLDFSVEEVEKVLDLASDIEKNPAKYAHACDGKVLATLFYEPSTRTRLSFESAMIHLGGQVLGFSSAASSSASKGESVSDTIRMISCYADICAMRHPKEGAPMVASAVSGIPVILSLIHILSAAQFRVLPGIKKSSNLFYNHLIPQTKITQRTGKPTPRLSYK